MQCIYALTLSQDQSLEKQKKFLDHSVNQTYVLYLLVLEIFRELHAMMAERLEKSSKKYLRSPEPTYPNPKKFLENEVLLKMVQNEPLSTEIKKRKLKHWYLNEEYIKILLQEILASEPFESYMKDPDQDFEQDRTILITLFKEIIAPNDKIYDFLEDESLTWVDDIPLVNTFVIKKFKEVRPSSSDRFFLPKLVKSEDDLQFARDLLVKTLLNNEALENEIDGKTPNWDTERIADIDRILLKMAISELLYFSSIPERVTINEYLEIAKEYSTPKSSIFINGILDKLTKEYKIAGKLKKSGRGLL